MEREFFPPYQAPAAGTTNALAGGVGSAAVAAAAMQRGRIVDLQLSEWCKAVRAGRGGANWLPSRRIHPFTAKIRAAFLGSWGWEPVRAQVGVRSRSWRLGTRCDLVVRDRRTGRLFLVEIKTASAYGGAWAHDNGQRFHAPLQNVVSCPMNHALAQLTLTLALVLADERPTAAHLRRRLAGAYVVVVDSASVRRYPMPPWCLRLNAEMARRFGDGRGGPPVAAAAAAAAAAPTTPAAGAGRARKRPRSAADAPTLYD